MTGLVVYLQALVNVMPNRQATSENSHLSLSQRMWGAPQQG